MSQTVGRTNPESATLRSYTIGFALSLTLTLIPFALVLTNAINGNTLIAVVLAFALAQLLVQLKFFIHLGHESGTQWNKIVFLFTMMVVFIIVGGSIWIMSNLSYHDGGHGDVYDGSDTKTKADDYQHYNPSSTPSQKNDFIIKDEGFKP